MRKLFLVLSVVLVVILVALGYLLAPDPEPLENILSSPDPPPSREDPSGDTTPKNSPIVTLAGPFNNGLAPVYDGEHWGYIGRDGTWRIKPRFRSALPFTSGIAKVQEEDRWYYINSRGEKLLGGSRQVSPHANRRNTSPFPYRADGEWGYADTAVGTVVPPVYNWAGGFSEGRAPVERDGQIGYLNDEGDTITGFLFRDGGLFSNGRAAVRYEDHWGYINREGTTVIEPQYDWAKKFRNGLAPVRKDSRWGYVNRDGEMIVEPRYDFAAVFRDRRALVKKDNRFGFLGPEGNLRIPLRYTAAGSFFEGRARVQRGSDWGYVDRSGDTVIPFRYEIALNYSDGLAAVYDDRHWAYVDRSGSQALSIPKLNPANDILNDTSYRLKRLRTLTELQPLFTPGGREYVTSEKRTVPRWHLSRPNEDQPVGMYKVTRYPYKNPSALQHEGAEELLRLSRAVAERKNWWNLENKPERYDNRQFKADRLRAHYLSRSDLGSPETLNPRRPEWLIYYPTPRGRRLAGFMFSTLSRSRGPQIGGPLTQWHYHQKQKNRIQRCRDGALPGVRKTPCEERDPVRHTPLMLHVWFIEHASGPFGSSPKLKPYIMDQLMDENYLSTSRLLDDLFCERNCLSKQYRKAPRR